MTNINIENHTKLSYFYLNSFWYLKLKIITWDLCVDFVLLRDFIRNSTIPSHEIYTINGEGKYLLISFFVNDIWW